MWNFKGYLWNFTQNFEPIHGKMCILLCSMLACDLRHLWIVTSYALVRRALGGSIKIFRPRQNDRHFADDTFKLIFLNEIVRISIEISLKFVSKGLINNIPALVQIMGPARPGYKSLSQPMMVSLLTHVCVWCNYSSLGLNELRFFSCKGISLIKIRWWWYPLCL